MASGPQGEWLCSFAPERVRTAGRPVARVRERAFAHCDAGLEGASHRRVCAPGPSLWESPPGVHSRNGVGPSALLEESSEPEEIGRDADGALHPARAGWQQGVCVAVLDKAPEGVIAVVDGAIDEGVTEDDCEGEVVIAAVALPGAEDDVGDPRDAQRVQTGSLQLVWRRRQRRRRRDRGPRTAARSRSVRGTRSR